MHKIRVLQIIHFPKTNLIMVVWTGAQTTAFFTSSDQMDLPADTYNQIQSEGIITVQDLSEFEEESFK